MTSFGDTENIEWFFCNECKHKTKHFIRGEHKSIDRDDANIITYTQRMLIVECCGCEHLALVKLTHFSEDIEINCHPTTGEEVATQTWDEAIYPPVTYREPPSWFEDLPDDTLREISAEIYKSLQTDSLYLATFGSRTLIDRLILLTVGDQGNFNKGLKALQEKGFLSEHEKDILKPVVDAGHAAAHRGWSASDEQIGTILDTVESLIHRLLVLPKLAEELDDAVPNRLGSSKSKTNKSIVTIEDKIESAPGDLREVYDSLREKLMNLGNDVTVRPQKHYIAFRRNRNFASVQIYNQKRLMRIYLNIDPEAITLEPEFMRDVRQIGHFGTGDLETTVKSMQDIDRILPFLKISYENS